jgi:phage terminase large subunit-like protein
VRARVESGIGRRIAIIGATARDVREVMVGGEAGLLAISPPWCMPRYEPSKARIVWPNGAVGRLFSAEKPARLRGPAHDTVWGDEAAAWQYPETWDMAMMGLRAGDDPRAAITTTPRPIPLIRELLAEPGTAIVRGTTYDNRSNLPPSFLGRILRRYEGTRIGRQELLAELLDDVPGALWTREILERGRVKHQPELVRIVVAIDPAMTSGEKANETGIVAAGKDERGHAYVLADRSGRYTPAGWARAAIALYRELNADCIVAEVNAGGELVERNIRIEDDSIPYRKVHASHGKYTRAEPVSALYEPSTAHPRGRVPRRRSLRF